MGVPLTLKNIQSGFLTATAFNANNTLVEQALAKTLNRTSNATDNAMEVDLDLGLNNIINVNLINGEDISNLSGNLTIVANLDDEINTVAGIASDVSTVAADSADVQAVGGDIANVNTVATNLPNIDTVATDIANVNTVATDIANVNNVSNNIDDVTSFADLYLGSKTSDPATDNDGDPLLTSALYFNTNTDQLRIYDGSAWQNAAFGATSAAGVTYDNTTSGLTATDAKAAFDELEANKPDYEETNIVLGQDFDSIPAKLVRVGKNVTLYFLSAIQWTASRSSQSTFNDTIPVGFRYIGSGTQDYSTTDWLGLSEVARFVYVPGADRITVTLGDVSNGTSTSRSNWGLNAPTLHWVTED